MADIVTGYTDLSNAVKALQSEDAVVVSAIAALKAQVAAGSPVTGDQLEALARSVTGVGSDLATAISTATATATSTATSS